MPGCPREATKNKPEDETQGTKEIYLNLNRVSRRNHGWKTKNSGPGQKESL